MNNTVDNLATKKLLVGVASQQFIDTHYLFEQIPAYAIKAQVTSSLRLSFDKQWDYSTVQAHFNKEQILAVENIQSVLQNELH